MKEIEIPAPVMHIQESTAVLPARVIEKPAEVVTLETDPSPTALREFLDEKRTPIFSEIQSGKEDLPEILAIPLEQTQESEISFPSETATEVYTEVGEREEDFKTLEAQKAYYAFMEAARMLDVKTGEGVEELQKAMDDVEVHAKDMAIPKLFSLIVVSFTLLMSIWGEKAGEEEIEDGKYKKVSLHSGDTRPEKQEKSFEKNPDEIEATLKKFSLAA